jgi:hypothetical protein
MNNISRERNDKTTNTPFSNWLYNFSGETKLCLSIHNLDYVIINYKLKKIMLIEEKRYNSELSYSQIESFKVINGFMSTGNYNDYKYCGFHIIIFENTTPNDGKMWFDNILINEDKLIEILDFKGNEFWYINNLKFNKL